MSAPGRPTLAEVARRAEVSVTTASYVLNGQSSRMRISPDTESRVLAAARSLGYRPNKSARSLRTQSTASIGLVLDDLAGGFAAAMLTGASDAAQRADRALLIAETGGDPERESRMIEELSDRQVDGFVYATWMTSDVAVPPGLQGHKVVLLNCVDPRAPFRSVVPDELGAGRAAARVLIDLGHQTFAMVGEQPSASAIGARLRIAGIRRELELAGLSPPQVLSCPWDPVAAYDVVTASLRRGAPPCALICLNDRVALGTYQALDEAGLRVPDDVSVVSFDGSDLASWLRPPVTSVALPFLEMGSLAVRMLLEPRAARARQITVPMVVRRGRSTAGARDGVPETAARRGSTLPLP